MKTSTPSRARNGPDSTADAVRGPLAGTPDPASRRRPAKRTVLLVLNAVSIVAGIATWWILALNGFQFPAPPEVVEKATELWQDGILQRDILASLGRVLTGFLLGSAVAVPVGFLMGWYTVGARPVRAVDPVLPHDPAARPAAARAGAHGHRRDAQGVRHLPRRVPRLRHLDLPGRGRASTGPSSTRPGCSAPRTGRSSSASSCPPRRRSSSSACASASDPPGRPSWRQSCWPRRPASATGCSRPSTTTTSRRSSSASSPSASSAWSMDRLLLLRGDQTHRMAGAAMTTTTGKISVQRGRQDLPAEGRGVRRARAASRSTSRTTSS